MALVHQSEVGTDKEEESPGNNEEIVLLAKDKLHQSYLTTD
jgi:hypothetical protein